MIKVTSVLYQFVCDVYKNNNNDGIGYYYGNEKKKR